MAPESARGASRGDGWEVMVRGPASALAPRTPQLLPKVPTEGLCSILEVRKAPHLKPQEAELTKTQALDPLPLFSQHLSGNCFVFKTDHLMEGGGQIST
jgi:hypothetical protein